MIIYPKVSIDIQKSIYIGNWNYSQIPIFHVPTIYALNQLIGYVKHINAKSGTVLYRGQCNLYENVKPSIQHDGTKMTADADLLSEAIQVILEDEKLAHFFGFRNNQIRGWDLYEKLIIEATLQHYGAKTFCVDFVDNHWTALWFGLNRWNADFTGYELRVDDETDPGNKYISYSKNYRRLTYPKKPTLRSISLDDHEIEKLKKHASHGSITLKALKEAICKSKLKSEIRKWEKQRNSVDELNSLYDSNEKASHLYIFLYVAETNSPSLNGVYFGEKTYTIDLRKALPSTFLRPCSQHGWIVRGINNNYEFNSNICCVIRVNVDLAKKMVGDGILLSQNNFFPDESVDQGYNILLQRQKGSRLKTKYKKIIPNNMIIDYYAPHTS